jgi:hypothetical protein
MIQIVAESETLESTVQLLIGYAYKMLEKYPYEKFVMVGGPSCNIDSSIGYFFAISG